MKKGKKILATFLAVLMVVGIMPINTLLTNTYAATTFTGGEEVKDGTWKGWIWDVFGSGINTNNNTIKETNNGITLSSTGNKGKINGNGTEQGLNTFMYKVEKTSDFLLTAKAELKSIGDNQAAFGLMVRDKIGKHNDTTKKDNSGFAFIGGFGKNSKNDNKSDGIASVKKTDENQGKINKILPVVGETYDLAIQKIGDNITLYANGVKYADCKASEIITDDTMYVGIFTSRNAVVDYSDIKLSTTKDSSKVTVNKTSDPTKTVYCAGNTYADIDMSGFKATATVDGKEKEITAKDCIINYNDKDGKGIFTSVTDSAKIVVTYLGQDIEVPVSVIKEVVDDVTINYLPIKTDYLTTDTAIDFTGLDGTVTYNSGRTFKLQDLIANNDVNTKISTVDFTTPGETSVEITHTYGDVSKKVSIPITVSDAIVTGIEVTNPNTTRFYTDTVYDADAYVEGLTITAKYSDNTTKVIAGTEAVKGYVSPKANALDTTKTGNYTYVVNYNGNKAEYTLEVVKPEVTGIQIKNYPNTTTYAKGTAFNKDGLEVEAVYESGKTVVLAASDYSVDSSAFDKDTEGTYDIKISATVDGKSLSTSIKATVKDKTDFKFGDRTWKTVMFGQSVSKDKMSVTESDGKVVIEAKEGGGKLTDDGQDGIMYYYTELDATKDNFDITAKVTVNYFITKSSADDQEGFGIMVRDAINTNGDSSIYYSNAMSVGGYYGQYNVFGRYGVTDGDAGSRKNITKYGKLKELDRQIKEDNPKTFTLRLKKDNSGIYAWMKDDATGKYVTGYTVDPANKKTGEDTNAIENTFYYLPANTFSTINDTMYLGFFAARGAKITVDTSSVDMIVTDAAADAPQTFAPETATVPSVSQASLSETSSENYTFKTTVNTKGLLTVKKDGKTIVNQMSVEKGTYSFDTILTVGANKFQVYFEPDATQNINPKTPVVMNSTVTRRVIAPVKKAIYCAPNGTSTAAGTKEDPVDVQTALTYCQPGQAVYALGGTYNLTQTTGVWHGNDGTGEDGMKYFMAAPDNKEDVVFDFGGSFKDNKFVANTFDFSGDYWYISDIKFGNGGGVRLGGSHCVMERCDFYGHSNSGLSISRTDGSNNKADWPSYNQIINCNAYNNSDKSQNNADGFAAKLTCGDGNVFKGCIAAYNADDGWDLFSKGSTGAIGEVEIYDSICYGNGFLFYDGNVEKTKGDGNGFKMGGSGIAVNHKVYNSYSFGNAANGFTNNSDPLGTYVNCVGYNNGGSNLELHTYTGVDPQFTVENFKSYADDSYKEIITNKNVQFIDGTDKESKEEVIKLYYSTNNYFIDKNGKSVNKDGVEITADNWKSLKEFKDIITGGIKAMPRDAEGNIALGDFLQYVEIDNSNSSDVSTEPASQTGDSMHAIPYALAMIISAGFVILVASRKKKYVK